VVNQCHSTDGCIHDHHKLQIVRGESGSPTISAARRTVSVPSYTVIFLQHFLRVAFESLVLCLQFGSYFCAPFGGHLPLLGSFVVFSAPAESTGILTYRGADKSLARPGRKQDVSVRMAWISFGALPCRENILMAARVSILLKSRAVKWATAAFIPSKLVTVVTSEVLCNIDLFKATEIPVDEN